MKKRYPGPLPFTYDDRNLFFGRDQEIEYLTTLIINNQITILHGKSGYGKSSLINAGLIPNLLDHFNCEIIRVRFYNYDKANPLLPLDTFLNTIKQHVSGRPYLDGLLTVDHQSAWRYFKKLQHEVLKKFPDDEDANERLQSSYILVIDQFEELFTYPKEAVIALARELHEVLLHRIPEEYQECLKESFRKKENLEIYKEELSILDKDIPLKAIFALRTERFNYLTHLVSYIPTLLSNTYKIKRMTATQVKAAIVEPALVDDEGFNSPPFAYEPVIVEKLIDFLNAETKGDDGGKIEVFEMQIICQKLEALLIAYLAANSTTVLPQSPVLFKEDIIKKSTSIKDKNEPFAEIIKNYYKETIEIITDPVEQLSARYLIEFKLIDRATNNRISLDNAFVKQIGISEAVLHHLIDKRIIRIEINTVSGHSLEISHDSLIIPILNAVPELGSLDKSLSDFYETAIGTAPKSGINIRAIINNILLEESDVRKAAAAALDDEAFALLRSNPVIIEKEAKKGGNDIQAFGVKKIFQQTAQQSRAKTQQSSTKGWVKRFAVVSVVFVAVIVFMLVIHALSKKRENRLSALLFLSTVDTIKNKEEALNLTEYIYKKKVLNEADSAIIKNKILSLLHSQEAQALFSNLDFSIAGSNLKNEEIDLSWNGDFIVFNNKNNDGDEQWGTYVLFDNNGKKLKQFDKVLYSYFISQTNLALLALSSGNTDSLYSNGNKFSSQFIVYNCKTGQSQTISLEPNHYLYPPYYSASAQLSAYKNFRVQVTASGNFIIPVYNTSHPADELKQVKIKGDAVDKYLFSSGVISLSKDGTKLMTQQRANDNRTNLIIYNEEGELVNTYSSYDAGGFAQNGTLWFYKNGSFSTSSDTAGARSFKLNDKIQYADSYGKMAVVEGQNKLYIIDGTSGASALYNERLLGIDFKKGLIVSRGKAGETSPDTVWQRYFFNKRPALYFTCPEGIQSVVYNENAAAMLIFTKNEKLYLVDSTMQVKGGFQLTANDLFGFSEDGRRFYYVRNEAISLFKNDNKLVNLFDFEKANLWLQNHFETTGRSALLQRKERYDLRF